MQTILITGANGFVGSHLLETMHSRDDCAGDCSMQKRKQATFIL